MNLSPTYTRLDVERLMGKWPKLLGYKNVQQTHSTHMILIYRGDNVGGFDDGVCIYVGGVSVYV